MNGSALASFARAFYGEKKPSSTDITRRKEKNKKIKVAEEETVSNPREFMNDATYTCDLRPNPMRHINPHAFSPLFLKP